MQGSLLTADLVLAQHPQTTQLHIENTSGNGSVQITSSTSGTSFINMGDTGDGDRGQISYINNGFR